MKRTKELLLAEKIREIEQRYARSNIATAGFAGKEPNNVIETGWSGVDAALGGGLVRGALHEWFGLIEPSTTQNARSVRSPWQVCDGIGGTRRRPQSRGRKPADIDRAPCHRASARCSDGGLPPIPAHPPPSRTKNDDHVAAFHGRRGSWTPPVCLLVHLARQALGASIGTRRWGTPRGLKPAARGMMVEALSCPSDNGTLASNTDVSRHATAATGDGRYVDQRNVTGDGRYVDQRDVTGGGRYVDQRNVTGGGRYVGQRAGGASARALWAVWVGKRCFPYPGVLVRSDDGDGCLLERSIFVAPRDAASRLWAIDLALRSPAVGVVVADGSNFDMAATRRVQLVAKANGTCALLVRPPWELNELSAAQSRWLVRREASTGYLEPIPKTGIRDAAQAKACGSGETAQVEARGSAETAQVEARGSAETAQAEVRGSAETAQAEVRGSRETAQAKARGSRRTAQVEACGSGRFWDKLLVKLTDFDSDPSPDQRFFRPEGERSLPGTLVPGSRVLMTFPPGGRATDSYALRAEDPRAGKPAAEAAGNDRAPSGRKALVSAGIGQFEHVENPRWSVQLLRCKGVQPERAHGVWALEWNRATRTVDLSTAMVDPSREPQEATASTRGAALRPHRSA